MWRIRRGGPVIVKEYCKSMDKQLAAWKANVEKLLVRADRLSGKDRESDERRRTELQSLVDAEGFPIF
jgi:hypothetical protein